MCFCGHCPDRVVIMIDTRILTRLKEIRNRISLLFFCLISCTAFLGYLFVWGVRKVQESLMALVEVLGMML